MDGTIYYINTRGEKLVLSEWPLAVTDLTQLYLRTWGVQAVDNIPKNRAKIQYLYRTSTEFSLDISIYADSVEEYIELYNNFEAVTDYDVRQMSPGRLYVGDYYLECFLRDEKPSEYEEMFDTINITLTVYSAYPHWVREMASTFLPDSEGGGGEEPIPPRVIPNWDEVDPPYIRADYTRDYANEKEYTIIYAEKDYPYDYKGTSVSDVLQVNTDEDCDFTMTIWGYVVNPTIIIGGNTYAVNITIPTGSKCVIDSRYQTVTVYDAYGNATNVFNSRNKSESIFTPIPTGTWMVNWPESCQIDLILYDERSTPVWSF